MRRDRGGGEESMKEVESRTSEGEERTDGEGGIEEEDEKDKEERKRDGRKRREWEGTETTVRKRAKDT